MKTTILFILTLFLCGVIVYGVVRYVINLVKFFRTPGKKSIPAIIFNLSIFAFMLFLLYLIDAKGHFEALGQYIAMLN